MSTMSDDKPMSTLDWAALRAFVKKRKPVEVSAGILNDWFWTASTVYEDGKWLRNHRAYVTSYWATPGFKATMKNGDVIERVASRPQTAREDAAERRRAKAARKNLHKLANKLRAESHNPVERPERN